MAAPAPKPLGQILARLAFVCYCGWMLWLLFGQRLGTEVYAQQLALSINLKPLATVGRYLALLERRPSAALVRHAIVNLAGNVVMFIPLGFFLPCIFIRLRGFFRTALAALLLILAVELVQYFTMLGTCDIDDLILNMTGVFVGFLIWCVMRR